MREGENIVGRSLEGCNRVPCQLVGRVTGLGFALAEIENNDDTRKLKLNPSSRQQEAPANRSNRVQEH